MADRLSELHDDLLRFTPFKEAASTTALSRRWRAPLWLSLGALNLVTRVEAYCNYCHRNDGPSFFSCDIDRYIYTYRQRKEDEALFFSWCDAFLSEAVVALDAAQAPVTSLTLRIKSIRHEELYDFLNRDRHEDGVIVSRNRNVVDVLLSHRAAHRVEELRLVFEGFTDYVSFMVTLDTLPLETLRVLELTDCKGLYQRQGAAVVLPRLSSLLE